MDTHNTTHFDNVTLKWLGSNDTLDEVAQYFNLSVIQLSNYSDDTQTITQVKLFDLYEMYKSKEREQLMAYKFVAYILGSLIILSNLTVVISSGLILQKGQQPKSTYLLLGNVSLADTIVGISIIFGAIVDHNNVSSFCVFQIGMLVAPAMVSIFSVGLIAVDRYIYIVHGLYYQRWFTTTKVRIGILCIWMIGIILGFLPAMGWVNTEKHSRKCFYVYLFPGSLVLLNSLLSIIPILVVAVLYSIILVKALANVNKIRAAKKSATKQKDSQSQMPHLRIYREKNNAKTIINNSSMKNPSIHEKHIIKRSMSFNNHYENQKRKTQSRSFKSKSINDLNENDHTKINDSDQIHESISSSEFSICTIESSTDPNNSQSDVSEQPNRNVSNEEAVIKKRKIKEPNKLRAITVVMLTSGSFILTWLPFFIVVIFYVLCEEKQTNQKCINLRGLLAGPIATLAFINSVLNPLIYAWWHKGFKRSVKIYFRKIWQKYIIARRPTIEAKVRNI